MAYPIRLLMSGFVTHDTRRFVLERPEGLEFEPGQGVELTIERNPWRGQGHPFTPTCLPQDRVLELTIKRYPESDDFDRFFYVCGPPAFVEDVNQELATLGARPDRLVYER
jgi:cytochrome-b5 reductase